MATHPARDLTGMRFGRLVVQERVPLPKKNPRWRLVCDCGNQSEAYTGNLLSGRTKSCGCWKSGPTNYKAKEKVLNAGYVLVRAPGHPRASPRTSRVREHIIVMENVLGRYLLPGEEVHHKNGQRADNRPENLELWNRSQPTGVRVADQVNWAVAILQQYAPRRLSTTL